MKAENLYVLRQLGLRVPPFTVVRKGEAIDLSFSDKSQFAVRSSYDKEDGTKCSFAGQLETLLNVNRENVEEACRTVFSSATRANITTYENAVKQQEKDKARVVNETNESQAMSVIIQEMVHSKVSGVLFTANPLGILNEVVIVAGYGLGNQVVEDRIDTTTIYMNIDDHMYLCDGTEETPVLSKEQIEELTNTASLLRTHFGQEMDVEYAIADGVIYYLQARPITTFSKDGAMPIILDNSNIVESYPGISLPLTQSFVHEIYYKVFEALVYRLTKSKSVLAKMDPFLQHMTESANGRIYYCISNWYAVLKLLPFSRKVIAIWQEMLGVNQKTVVWQHFRISLGTKLRLLCGFVYYLNKTPKLMEELNQYFNTRLPQYWESVHAACSKQELLLLYDNLRAELTSRWDITLVNDMYAFIYTALAGKKHRNQLSSIKNLESMKPVIAMEDLVAYVKENGVSNASSQEKMAQYIEEYGDRILEELKLETKTYRSNPNLLEEYLVQELGRREKEKTEASNKDVTDAVKRTSLCHKTKERKSLFVRRAKRGIYHREVSRLNRSRLFGIARAILLKVGALMEAEGNLLQKEDIFYLYYEEVCVGGDLRDLVAKRKKEYEDFGELPAFSRLVFEKKIINKHLKNATSHVLSDGILRGTVVSSGTVTGEVLLIDKPDTTIDTTSKIIVTKMTDPGWVFLVKNCAGIIAEKGSMLSHTAIITRELGKPAVVNVKDATRILKNGDVVTLDADEGVVTRKK